MHVHSRKFKSNRICILIDMEVTQELDFRSLLLKMLILDKKLYFPRDWCFAKERLKITLGDFYSKKDLELKVL